MKFREALRRGADLIADLGSDEAHLEARLLLQHAVKLTYERLGQRLENVLSAEQERVYRALLKRRLAREPVAYILGRKEFYGLEFEVSPAAIIPRPETEVLIEAVLAFVRSLPPDAIRVADVGTGCGAIAVALAANLPPAVQLIALDSSGEALALARRNAERHGLAGRIEFLRGDLLAPLRSPVDAIAANLPYVTTAAWEALPPESRDHEPRLGLDGGPDGLRLVERLLRQAPSHLRPGGALFAEIGDEQGAAAVALARGAFPAARIEVRPDLAGLDRVLVVEA